MDPDNDRFPDRHAGCGAAGILCGGRCRGLSAPARQPGTLLCRDPASTWDAILSYIRDPADAARLADSARSRLLYGSAISLYCHAADAGDGVAASRLAGCWPGAATSPYISGTLSTYQHPDNLQHSMASAGQSAS
jgi:hypothetical protein